MPTSFLLLPRLRSVGRRLARVTRKDKSYHGQTWALATEGTVVRHVRRGCMCRAGVGKAIVTVCEAVSQTAATQLSSMCLHVRSTNEGAIAFYESVGFETTAEDSARKALRGQARHRTMVKHV